MIVEWLTQLALRYFFFSFSENWAAVDRKWTVTDLLKEERGQSSMNGFSSQPSV